MAISFLLCCYWHSLRQDHLSLRLLSQPLTRSPCFYFCFLSVCSAQQPGWSCSYLSWIMALSGSQPVYLPVSLRAETRVLAVQWGLTVATFLPFPPTSSSSSSYFVPVPLLILLHLEHTILSLTSGPLHFPFPQKAHSLPLALITPP